MRHNAINNPPVPFFLDHLNDSQQNKWQAFFLDLYTPMSSYAHNSFSFEASSLLGQV